MFVIVVQTKSCCCCWCCYCYTDSFIKGGQLSLASASSSCLLPLKWRYVFRFVHHVFCCWQLVKKKMMRKAKRNSRNDGGRDRLFWQILAKQQMNEFEVSEDVFLCVWVSTRGSVRNIPCTVLLLYGEHSRSYCLWPEPMPHAKFILNCHVQLALQSPWKLLFMHKYAAKPWGKSNKDKCTQQLDKRQNPPYRFIWCSSLVQTSSSKPWQNMSGFRYCRCGGAMCGPNQKRWF